MLQFGVIVESKLPPYNTRVKLPQTQRDVYDGKRVFQLAPVRHLCRLSLIHVFIRLTLLFRTRCSVGDNLG